MGTSKSRTAKGRKRQVVSSDASLVLLFTCEHGGHDIPATYRKFFRGATKVLKSHRGWDPGALELAERFAARCHAPLYSSTVSRLLVELNRSLHHRSLFSEYTRDLTPPEQTTIVQTYYLPHREAVERQMRDFVAAGRLVLHFGVHSFTPELNGVVRQADSGLLYDPQRAWEQSFCTAWRSALRKHSPELRVRKNYPYLGTSDGFTTYLRTRFANSQYAGVELEMNQRFALGAPQLWETVQETLVATMLEAVVL